MRFKDAAKLHNGDEVLVRDRSYGGGRSRQPLKYVARVESVEVHGKTVHVIVNSAVGGREILGHRAVE